MMRNQSENNSEFSFPEVVRGVSVGSVSLQPPHLHSSASFEFDSRFSMSPPKLKQPENFFALSPINNNNKSNLSCYSYSEPIPSYHDFSLEQTNFDTSLNPQDIISKITKFLNDQNISYVHKPKKYKFKCHLEEGNIFVIRLFNCESRNCFKVEVQHRLGCVMLFTRVFNALKMTFENKNTTTDPNPISTISPLSNPKHDDDNDDNDDITNDLLLIKETLNSSMIDTQEIGVYQLSVLLNSLKGKKTIEMNEEIERSLHELMTDFWYLKNLKGFNNVLKTLDILYTFTIQRNNDTEQIDYHKSLSVLLEAISYSSQTTFICFSIASVLTRFIKVCPQVLMQSDIVNKLRLAIVRHSQRDTFKNVHKLFQEQLNLIIQQLQTI